MSVPHVITPAVIPVTLLLLLVGVLFIVLTPEAFTARVRSTTLVVSLLALLLGITVYFSFDPHQEGWQFTFEAPWLPFLGSRLSFGLDGLNLPLYLLTLFLGPICVLVSVTEIQERVREFHICLLLTEIALIGVFTARDLLLFYAFWEVLLVPMFLIIAVWGSGNRVYAGVKFLIYTLVGGLLMLVAIIVTGWAASQTTPFQGHWTFQFDSLLHTRLDPSLQMVLFLGFAFAFAIKVPMFPFHTWLPDAHTEAPTAGSVILAGLLLKMGSYGFLRFALPLFPDAAYQLSPILAFLSLVAVIYGGLMSWVQTDIKRLIAYSSVAHMGLITLGLFSFHPTALSGSLIQMVNHGLSTGMLFILVGMLYERRHTRRMDQYGGLANIMGGLTAFFLIALLSSIGLPGLNGFVGEFLILAGVFQVRWLWAACAVIGVLLSAVYMLWLFRRVFHGPITVPENRHLPDLSFREKWLVLAPITFFLFLLGIYPACLLKPSEATLRQVSERVLSQRGPSFTRQSKGKVPMVFQKAADQPIQFLFRREVNLQDASPSGPADSDN